MKPRKLILTIEMLTDIPSKEFTKLGMQDLFNNSYKNPEETLTIHQVRTQVVKETK